MRLILETWRYLLYVEGGYEWTHDYISASLALGQDYNASCYCTPKCDRNVYVATVSHAEVSKAMLNALSGHQKLRSYSRSANRLEDYVIMYHTNESWATSLYQLSNLYKDSRKNILDISAKLEVFIGEINGDDLHRSEQLCLLMALDMINNIMLEFSAWEKNTFYLNHSYPLHYENFISHIANDMVRGLGKLDGFVSGFIHYLRLIGIASEMLSRCNQTNSGDPSSEIQDVIEQENNSIAAFYEEYKRLSQIVYTNQQIMSYRLNMDDSSVKWVIVSMGGVHIHWSVMTSMVSYGI